MAEDDFFSETSQIDPAWTNTAKMAAANAQPPAPNNLSSGNVPTPSQPSTHAPAHGRSASYGENRMVPDENGQYPEHPHGKHAAMPSKPEPPKPQPASQPKPQAQPRPQQYAQPRVQPQQYTRPQQQYVQPRVQQQVYPSYGQYPQQNAYQNHPQYPDRFMQPGPSQSQQFKLMEEQLSGSRRQSRKAAKKEKENGFDGYAQKRGLTRRSLIVSIILTVFVLGALGAALYFVYFPKDKELVPGRLSDNLVLSQILTTDGNSVVFAPGELQMAVNEMVSLRATSDRNHVVVYTQHGELGVFDANNVGTPIDTEVNALKTVTDNYCIYTKENGQTWALYFYAKDEVSYLPTARDVAVSQNAKYLSYLDAEGGLYLLNASTLAGTKIADTQNKVAILYIANEGDIVVWVEYGDGENNVYMHKGSSKAALVATYTGTSSYFCSTRLVVNSSETVFFVHDPSSGIVGVYERGDGRYRSVSIPEGAVSSVYSDYCLLSEDTQDRVGRIFVTTQGILGLSVYAIDVAAGSRNLVVNDVLDFAVSRGHAYYVDGEGELYRASTSVRGMGTPQQIDTHVVSFRVSPTNEIVVYAKGNIGNWEDLYVYTPEPGVRLIGKQIYTATDAGDIYWVKFDYDGKYLFYIDNVRLEDGFVNVGILKRYDLESGQIDVIADKVLGYSVYSGFKGDDHNLIRADNFAFMVYDNEDADLEPTVDLYHWNKGKATLAVSDILD